MSGGTQNAKKLKPSNHNTREIHEQIKEVPGQGRKQKGSNCITDKNGNMLFDKNKIIMIWEKYITTLYNNTRGNPPDFMNDEGEEICFQRLRTPSKT